MNDGEQQGSPATSVELPTAVLVARRDWFSWAWLAPLVALVSVALLAWQALAARGPIITISFRGGEGIAAGDPVSFRGVRVGAVRSVTLAPTLDEVLVRAELNRDAAGLAHEGANFWIVRPEVSLRRVSGLETLLGPRYIAVQPGPGGSARATRFVGMDRPPSAAQWGGGGLSIIIAGTRAASVAVGSPVTYREVRVGSVTDIRLSEDSRAVNVHALIDSEYAHLVRTNSRFWNNSGIGLDLGLMGGLKFKAESLESVLAGGIGFATPERAGDLVANGQKFFLESAPKDEWLEWSPALPPPGPSAPSP